MRQRRHTHIEQWVRWTCQQIQHVATYALVTTAMHPTTDPVMRARGGTIARHECGIGLFSYALVDITIDEERNSRYEVSYVETMRE